MQIELPILFTTKESKALDDAGLPDDFNKFDVRCMTFYSVDNVSPYTNHSHDYKLEKDKCVISSGGLEYICNMSYDSVIKKISQEKKRELIKCN